MPMSLTFPMQIDKRGKLAEDQDRQSIDRSQLLFVLGTAVGERVMRPQFGASVNEAIASIPNASFTGTADREEMARRVIQEVIQNVFDKHFPRLRLVDVQIAKEYSGSVLYVDVFWAYPPVTEQSSTYSGRLDVSKYVNQMPGE